MLLSGAIHCWLQGGLEYMVTGLECSLECWVVCSKLVVEVSRPIVTQTAFASLMEDEAHLIIWVNHPLAVWLAWLPLPTHHLSIGAVD